MAAPSPTALQTTPLVVRNLRFDLLAGTPRYWFGGNPARTHVMNALSTTFPEGEALFVRSVHHYRERIADPGLLARIRGFAGQEAVHSREHDAHVKLLVAQGYRFIAVLNRLQERESRAWNRRAPRGALAVTAALEHITAILARSLLRDPERTETMHPEMARLWQWHALEEAEHKSVAFDVLQSVSRSYVLRVAAMLFATLGLLADTLLRFTLFTARDRNLFRPRVWLDGARFLWGRDGLFRALIPDYLRWYRRDFHPDQQDDRALVAAALARLAL